MIKLLKKIKFKKDLLRNFRLVERFVEIYFLTAFAGALILIIYGTYKLLKLLAGVC